MGGLLSFQPKMKEIHDQINKEINFKTADLEDLINLPMNEVEKNILPAIVLAVGRMVEKKAEHKIMATASIFQYIFLANQVHRLVQDHEQPQNERQFPVLVGDYLFGQAFYKICQDDLFPYMNRFTKVIETTNEGVVLRWNLKNSLTLNDLKNVLSKEKAAMTTQAAGITAELLELPTPFKKKVEELGFCIGLAWGLWDESANSSLIQEYLKRIKELVFELKDYYNVEQLLELSRYLNDAFLTRVKLTSK